MGRGREQIIGRVRPSEGPTPSERAQFPKQGVKDVLEPVSHVVEADGCQEQGWPRKD